MGDESAAPSLHMKSVRPPNQFGRYRFGRQKCQNLHIRAALRRLRRFKHSVGAPRIKKTQERRGPISPRITDDSGAFCQQRRVSHQRRRRRKNKTACTEQRRKSQAATNASRRASRKRRTMYFLCGTISRTVTLINLADLKHPDFDSSCPQPCPI